MKRLEERKVMITIYQTKLLRGENKNTIIEKEVF
jgi:hypothetical protein